MPSYRLMFDHKGYPCLEEEFSGDCPDETGFRAAMQGLSRRAWSSIVAEADDVQSRRGFARNDRWGLASGANDPESSSKNDSDRPAPFSFG